MWSIVLREPFQISQEKCFLAPNSLFFLWILSSLPSLQAAVEALNGALILTPLSKLLCRRFQRREIALASLIYVKTRFLSFLPPPSQKTLPETAFKFLSPLRGPTSSCDVCRRLGKPIQSSSIRRPRLRECSRQVEAEVVSNSRIKIHQTWQRPYGDSQLQW